MLCPEAPTLTKPVKPDKKGLQSLGVPIIESGLRSKPWNLIRAESPRSGRPANLRREAMSRIAKHHRPAAPPNSLRFQPSPTLLFSRKGTV